MFGDVHVGIDDDALAALNDPDAIVGRAAQRAADVTAERMRDAIRSADLIDTGRMLGDVQTRLEVTSADEVRIAVGTPNTPYALYQRQHFLMDSLDQLSPADFDE